MAACTPDGTSIDPPTKPTCWASCSFEAVEASLTGRVWGAPAGKPPKPTISRVSMARATSTTAAENDRQRRSGSGPTRTARPEPRPSTPVRSTISGQTSSSKMPSVTLICGRRARWSSSSSPSK